VLQTTLCCIYFELFIAMKSECVRCLMKRLERFGETNLWD